MCVHKSNFYALDTMFSSDCDNCRARRIIFHHINVMEGVSVRKFDTSEKKMQLFEHDLCGVHDMIS